MTYSLSEGGEGAPLEHQVLHFAEPSPGIFFPERVEIREVRNGVLVYGALTTVSRLKVNAGLPPETFVLPFPAGTQVFDRIQGKTYKLGADGQPEGAQVDIPPVRPPGPPAGGKASTFTQEEPKSPARWILPVSACVVAVGGSVWLIRKARRRA
jgi:hypothetical protein